MSNAGFEVIGFELLFTIDDDDEVTSRKVNVRLADSEPFFEASDRAWAEVYDAYPESEVNPVQENILT